MYTRCPQCDTVFRVTSQQLQASSGQVRCGRCDTVFDAFSSLSATPPTRRAATPGPEPAPRSLGPLAAVRASASAASREPQPPGVDELPAPSLAWSSPAAYAQSAPTAGALGAVPLTLPEELFQPGLISPRRRRAWLAANVLLLCALAGQAAWHFAVPLATHVPGLAPALEVYCRWLGCRFGLPRVPEQLFIEASDLQLLDGARPGQVLLTATIRNRAPHVQAFPLIELTLTGADNRTAARRVFPPAEYLDATLDVARGIEAQQEVNIRLYLDTADLHATGYRLYLFFT